MRKLFQKLVVFFYAGTWFCKKLLPRISCSLLFNSIAEIDFGSFSFFILRFCHSLSLDIFRFGTFFIKLNGQYIKYEINSSRGSLIIMIILSNFNGNSLLTIFLMYSCCIGHIKFSQHYIYYQ